MKKITKTHAPAELQKWCNENRQHNHSYNDLAGTQAHTALKTKLLSEQGFLCAYTGIAIDDKSSHIEHIKPQNKCDDWEEVDYRNVVACHPNSGGDMSYGYGAPIKAGWWDETLFVSPLSNDCEQRFRFSWSGHVYPNPENHTKAIKTIEVLCLDKVGLQQLRKSRIDGFFGFGNRSRSKPLSLADARTALANIDQFDGNGKLREFCFVLKQLLPKYIAQGEGQ